MALHCTMAIAGVCDATAWSIFGLSEYSAKIPSADYFVPVVT